MKIAFHKILISTLFILTIFFILWLLLIKHIENKSQTKIQSQLNLLNNKITVVAVGDIACDQKVCKHEETAKIISSIHPDAILTLGDTVYVKGNLEDFLKYYEPSWGKFKSITYPSLGNHEYTAYEARGYFDYFNGKAIETGRAGTRGKGYYSFDLGSWHFIVLNSECNQIGGCGFNSAQEKWLRNDLMVNKAKCTLAYWHEPYFSSGEHGSTKVYSDFWKVLYENNVDLVLAGHDHDYERFAKQDSSGNLDEQRGIREFVVGTGGRSLYQFKKIEKNSEVRNNNTYGVLKLILDNSSYEWKFVSIEGGIFNDSGKDACH